MSKNILKVRLYEEPDTNDEFSVGMQRVVMGDETVFMVYNLYEFPEDATIDRDLFNAYDYVRALNKGIQLAKDGIDEVKIEGVDENNQD